MPTRLIPQHESIGELLKQPEASQEIVGSRPRWALQSKYRDHNDSAMQEKHVLKDGFAAFYSSTEPVVRIGDTVRRHLYRPDGQEAAWRPSCRPVEPVQQPPKAYGKRYVQAPGANHQEEIDDLPRGRRRVAPPPDQLPEESPMFQLKHSVRDAETGQRVAEKMSDLNEREKPRGPKLVASETRRNGLGQSSAGDKPYNALEVSPEYMATRNPARPRVEPLQPRLPPIDQWARKEAGRQLQSEINEVRSLPKF